MLMRSLLYKKSCDVTINIACLCVNNLFINSFAFTTLMYTAVKQDVLPNIFRLILAPFYLIRLQSQILHIVFFSPFILSNSCQ